MFVWEILIARMLYLLIIIYLADFQKVGGAKSEAPCETFRSNPFKKQYDSLKCLICTDCNYSEVEHGKDEKALITAKNKMQQEIEIKNAKEREQELTKVRVINDIKKIDSLNKDSDKSFNYMLIYTNKFPTPVVNTSSVEVPLNAIDKLRKDLGVCFKFNPKSSDGKKCTDCIFSESDHSLSEEEMKIRIAEMKRQQELERKKLADEEVRRKQALEQDRMKEIKRQEDRKRSILTLSRDNQNLFNAKVKVTTEAPPRRVFSGIPTAFKLPETGPATELCDTLSSSNAAVIPLPTTVREKDGSSIDNNLQVSAVGVPSETGGIEVKVEINVKKVDNFGNPAPENVYNAANYGWKAVSIEAPHEALLTSYDVEVIPEDTILPPQTYEFWDGLNNNEVVKEIKLTVTDSKGEKFIVKGAGKLKFPGDTAEGALVIEPEVEGFNSNPIKAMKYKDLVRSEQIVRYLLNPIDGKSRVILAWAENPTDLDLHCYSSRGEHIYFGNKNPGGNISLDQDVTTGKGPETITVYIERGVSYWFYVHHLWGVESLAVSGATLTAYGIPGVSTITIPSGCCVDYSSGRGYWDVFAIDESGVVRVVNQIVEGDDLENPRKF